MNFIIDAHLPQTLATYFTGHDVIHTSSLANGNDTLDKQINDLSVQEKRVLISKDVDFYYSFISGRRPYKLVLVKLGNMRLKELKTYFANNTNRIIELLHDHSFLILEPTRIRVLE